MITRKEFEEKRQQARVLLQKTGIAIRSDEFELIEVVDLGLSELAQSGAQILTLINTEKIGVKLLILLPNQTMPEHKHPSIGNYTGKEETFRCEW